jgi:hypothetical protein
MLTEKECSNFWANKLVQNNFKFSTEEQSKNAKLEYDQQCGMYDPKVLDCIQLNTKIDVGNATLGNQALMYFDSDKTFNKESLDKDKKDFADKGCVKLIEQYRQSELGKVAQKFSGLDKARIESESKYQQKQRIFFGGLVLLAGVVVITMFSKKK